jgi:hypothetical protein
MKIKFEIKNSTKKYRLPAGGRITYPISIKKRKDVTNFFVEATDNLTQLKVIIIPKIYAAGENEIILFNPTETFVDIPNNTEIAVIKSL